MFRQALLPCACLTLALGVAIVAVPSHSWGQDRSTEDRLDRVERDLNMLQRQVYQGAPPPPMSGGDGGGSAVDVEVRMERLEQRMRDLTGRLEEVVNQVSQLKQRIEQVNGDVDVRLGQASGSPAAPSGPLAANPPPRGPSGPLSGRPRLDEPPRNATPGAPPFPGPPGDPDDEPAPPGVAAGPGESRGGPTPIFGTLTPPGVAPPPSAMASAAPPPRPSADGGTPAGGLPGGSTAEQYDYAFGLVKKADYPGAEAALKAFVDRHPTDRNAGSAQYWLGETYYTRGRFLDAAAAFADGYKRYPKSPKAPDDLLKLAMSLARANQKQNACLALTQLDRDFPHPGGAVKEHAATERKRLGC